MSKQKAQGASQDVEPETSEHQEQAKVLVVEDERSMRRVLRAMLEKQGFEVQTATNGLEAIAALNAHTISVIISDIKMPEMNGMELLSHVMGHFPGIPMILITAHGTVDNAVEALKKGAFDYVTKPFDRDELQQVVQKAFQTYQLNSRYYRPVQEELGQYDIIGRSRKMMEIYEAIAKVADTPSTVLITGEHGTGKELVARALHQNSSRRDKPYITINCAAIPHNLMEAELFGYEKGAFTGAVSAKAGKFELADGGTLFLDEIGEIPVEMQVKLLRILQYETFERIGGVKTIKVNVRLVAATNRKLEDMIKEGTFREDLYYRLKVVPMTLPPLRERRSDIPLLVGHFIKRFNKRLNKEIEGITPEALTCLEEHDWPGNIRELENVMERNILFASEPRITLQDLPPELLQRGETLAARPPIGGDGSLSLPEMWKQEKERLERGMISQALDQTGGNVTQAAKILGISRKSLQKKMKELGLRES